MMSEITETRTSRILLQAYFLSLDLMSSLVIRQKRHRQASNAPSLGHLADHLYLEVKESFVRLLELCLSIPHQALAVHKSQAYPTMCAR